MNTFKQHDGVLSSHGDPVGYTGPPTISSNEKTNQRQIAEFHKGIARMERRIKDEIYKPSESLPDGRTCKCHGCNKKCTKYEKDPAGLENKRGCRYYFDLNGACRYPWQQLWAADLEGNTTRNKDLKGMDINQLYEHLVRLESSYNESARKYIYLK